MKQGDDPAGVGIDRMPVDHQAGRRYRHRLLRSPDAPLGPSPIQVRAFAKARIAELAEKRPRADRSDHGSMARLRQRGKSLLKRFAWELDIVRVPLDQIDATEFANWVCSLKPGMRPNSWAECRAAARAIIETLPHAQHQQHVALGMIDAETNDTDGRAHVRRGGADVGQRHSRIKKEDFDTILREMPSVSRSEAVPWLTDAMIATINSGTPWICWPTSTLEFLSPPGHPARTWLHIVHPNSATSPAPFARSLDISAFSPDTRASIKRMLRNAHSWTLAKEFHYRQTQINQCLYAVCARLFPRRPYPFDFATLRRQFCANMKVVCVPESAAALIGDIYESPPRHYRHSRQGWLKDAITEIPVPDELTVDMMSRRIRYHETRTNAKAARKNLAERRRAQRATRETVEDWEEEF